MIEKVIYDTNFIVALIDENDKWHSKAASIHNIIRKDYVKKVYFDCVINEVLSVIGKRLQEKRKSREFRKLVQKVSSHFPKTEISWIYAKTGEWFDEITGLMLKHEGRVNFHDAMISLAAREFRINHIVSFDKDFDEIKWIRRIGDPSDLK
jgi:predicted nucleic acid-binding protein